MLVATADVLNGQVSVNSGGLLHSLTISKPGVTTLVQCRPVAEDSNNNSGPRGSKPSGPTLLKAGQRRAAGGGSLGVAALKNHHNASVTQGMAPLPELLTSPQVPVATTSPLPNGLPTTLGPSKLFSSSNHSVVPGSLESVHLAKGTRNGSRPHQGRPDAGANIVASGAALQSSVTVPNVPSAKQQLYHQVLAASQVQAQMMPATLKLPLLLPNDERRHRPQQQQLKVPGGSLPT